MIERLEQRAKGNGGPPFELDFLRAIGFEFSQDYDGVVGVKLPALIDGQTLLDLVCQFGDGIQHQLERERQMAMRVCVGGPYNGMPYYNTGYPKLFHAERGKWFVYSTKHCFDDDPRAWYVGESTSKKKARQLWVSCDLEKLCGG